MLNRKFNIGVEVLTPVSIGAGAEKDLVRGVDFVVDGGNLYKLNLGKIVESGLDIKTLSNLYTSKDERGLLNRITKNRLDKVSDAILPYPAESSNDIKTFVRNQLSNNPLLAGSSIKGAIRSILFDYFRERETNESEVFGTLKKNEDFMRFIKISDGEFDDVALVNTKIFNLFKDRTGAWIGGWKHGANSTNSSFNPVGFNTIYECVLPGEKTIISLMLDENKFNVYNEHISKSKKKGILSGSISDLFKIINKHTRDYLQKERKFFNNYSDADRSDEVIDCIDTLLDSIPEDNSYCILKMSAGSGFHSITGDWMYNDYIDQPGIHTDGKNAGKKRYKSRKISIYNDSFSLMGFVKLYQASEEDIKDINEKRARKIANKIQSRKMEQELKEQLQKEQEMRVLHFQQTLSSAQSMEESGNENEALKLYKELQLRQPDNSDISDKIAQLEVIIQKKSIDERKKEEEKKRKEANKIPLADKINGVTKLPTLFGNVKTWKKQNGIEILSDSDRQILKEKIKELYDMLNPRDKKKMNNFGKDLEELISKETAIQWFEEISNS